MGTVCVQRALPEGLISVTDAEFAAILEEPKSVIGDIVWSQDEDHAPYYEFSRDVQDCPMFVRGSYNAMARTLTFALIHRSDGRLYALDMGKRHHNPSCHYVGDKHKHRWSERLRDKEAYEPDDITAPVTDVVVVWRQFCLEANLVHHGTMPLPPPPQGMLWI